MGSARRPRAPGTRPAVPPPSGPATGLGPNPAVALRPGLTSPSGRAAPTLSWRGRGGSPRRFLTKSSSFILRSGLTLGLYMSVLSRMMAKARMKMVSGFRNCRTTPGLQMQYRWLGRGGGHFSQGRRPAPPRPPAVPTPEAGHSSQSLCVCTWGPPTSRAGPDRLPVCLPQESNSLRPTWMAAAQG